MKEITVEAAVSNISAVTDFVNAQLEEMQCPPKVQMQIDLAIDELFSNISYYAYGGKPGPASVRFDSTDGTTAVLTFLDSGTPYNPLEAKEPDVTLPAEARSVGGLGIFLVRKLMDRIEYAYQNGQNVLTVAKTIR